MVDILISIASKVAECLIDPILHQLGYLINYKKNVDELRDQVEKLGNMKLHVKHLVEVAQRNGEDIELDVQSWLSSVDTTIKEMRMIDNEIELKKNCLFGCCPNCSYRYRLSKESTKKKVVVTRLQLEGKFKRVSYLPLLPDTEFLTSKDYLDVESRKSTVDQIMDVLKDDERDVIVLCGTNGIGKTTLAKEVGKRAKEQKLLDQVVMAVVSRTPDIKNIQGQIAKMLGLKFAEQSELGRAYRLNMRIKNEKKILIILDDVYRRLDLEAVGVPFADDRKGCKILLTSQNEHVCNTMGRHTNKISLNVLREEESWTLFKNVTGDIVDDPAFSDVAKDISGECGGLPLKAC